MTDAEYADSLESSPPQTSMGVGEILRRIFLFGGVAFFSVVFFYQWHLRGQELVLASPNQLGQGDVNTGEQTRGQTPAEAQLIPSDRNIETADLDWSTAALIPDLATEQDIPTLLALAVGFEKDGQLYSPHGKNALYMLNSAFAIDADNEDIKIARTALVGRIFELVEAAIAAGDFATAIPAISMIDATGINPDRLVHAKSSVDHILKLDGLLKQGASDLANGRLMQPLHDSAAHFFRQALQLEPNSQRAILGLYDVEIALLASADLHAADQQFLNALSLVADARLLNPTSALAVAAQSRISRLHRSTRNDLLDQSLTAMAEKRFTQARDLIDRAEYLDVPDDAVAQYRSALANARLYGMHQVGDVFHDALSDATQAGPHLVVVPRGSFLMGSPRNDEDARSNEMPQHAVSFVRGFAIARNEITVGQFRLFIKDTKYKTDAEKHGTSSIYVESVGRIVKRKRITWKNNFAGKRAKDDYPVLHISWDDIQHYTNWLSVQTGKLYRLPTEAEFEYALRAGTVTHYWWGSSSPSAVVTNTSGDGDVSRSRRRWTKSFKDYKDGYWGPAPVGSFVSNPFGLFDVAGNVAEWTLDCWHDNFSRAPSNGTAWINRGCDRRVIKGGSWGSSPERTRSAYRSPAKANSHGNRAGFRVVREL